MRTSDVIPTVIMIMVIIIIISIIIIIIYYYLLLYFLHCIYRVPIMTLVHSSRHVLDAACYTIDIISRHKVMTTTFSTNQKILTFDIMSRFMEIVRANKLLIMFTPNN